MKTILVPIDFSPVTRSVVSAAVALAKPTMSRLVILHAMQPPAVVADYGPMGAFAMPIMESMGQAAARLLDKWKGIVEARGLSVATVLLTGVSPSRVIAAEAERRSADYIVMGSHGHTGFYDLLIGSTTSGVLKWAHCPVVVVRARQKARRK
jgi:nucleotide-binding universal stress UspA family protein